LTCEAEVLAHLRGRYAPAAVLLVGSRADGSARPGSDWDLYVLLHGEPAGRGTVTPRPEVLEGALLDLGLRRRAAGAW
jgi:predicted nucleotidyltransferase